MCVSVSVYLVGLSDEVTDVDSILICAVTGHCSGLLYSGWKRTVLIHHTVKKPDTHHHCEHVSVCMGVCECACITHNALRVVYILHVL